MKKKKAASKSAVRNICMRCERHFTSKKALKMHSKAHLQALHELKMLENGQVPVETKFGFEFKGKNKIIVT